MLVLCCALIGAHLNHNRLPLLRARGYWPTAIFHRPCHRGELISQDTYQHRSILCFCHFWYRSSEAERLTRPKVADSSRTLHLSPPLYAPPPTRLWFSFEQRSIMMGAPSPRCRFQFGTHLELQSITRSRPVHYQHASPGHRLGDTSLVLPRLGQDFKRSNR